MLVPVAYQGTLIPYWPPLLLFRCLQMQYEVKMKTQFYLT